MLELIQQSMNKYNAISCDLKTIINAIEDNYDTGNLNKAFDLLLQYSLLEVVACDHKITESEISFIRVFSEAYPLTKFINSKLPVELTWKSFLEYDAAKTIELIKLVKTYMIDLGNILVGAINEYNKLGNADLTSNIKENVSFILSTQMEVDGSIEESELNYPCFINSILTSFVNKKEEVEEVVKSSKLSKDLINKKSDKLINYDQKELGLIYIETNVGTGSGFIVNEDGYAFTCQHVVEGSNEIYVRVEFEDGNRDVYKAEIVVEEKDHDLALIKILDCPKLPYFEVETDYKKVKSGNDVAIYGFPYGVALNEDVMELEPSINKGYISSKNKLNGLTCYFLDALSAPGNSGGPVFDESTKKVIGHLCGSYGSDRANLVFMRSLEYFVKEIL